jgi:hypothetical protein
LPRHQTEISAYRAAFLNCAVFQQAQSQLISGPTVFAAAPLWILVC